jgi:anthranilate synthase/aminodeoxychorismate synthase-like glutamine amidotransferase
MILIIDNYDSFVYNLYQIIAPMVDAVKVIRNDRITLADIESLQPQGIILSPGPGRPEDAGICVDIIQKYSGKIPILGVCLGHQAIAVAYGGEVISAGEIIHGKPETVFHTQQNIYRDMPQPFIAGRYHSLIVAPESLPADLIVDAKTQASLIMGMRHITHATFGVQFHPESILTPEGNTLLSAFCALTDHHA